MTALKFTDRDVRERPELVAEAVRYLRWYQGEFDFLVDAKRYEAANGNLPLGTARGVLNCMRVDARYAMVGGDLPAPAAFVSSTRGPRKFRVVEDEEERRDPFPLKTYWNARLLYSAHKGAEVVHALRPGSDLWCYPKHWDGNTIQLRGWLSGLCSTHFSGATERLARTMPEGKRFCHRCAEHIAEFGYDWGPTTPPPSLGENMSVENTSKRPAHDLFFDALLSPDTFITDMEKQGQSQLVQSDVLPTEAPWVELEVLGFVRGEPVEGDPIFTKCSLPEGWSKAGTSHSMWSNIVDERGIERVAVFYKAAFYDRSAHASLSRPGSRAAMNAFYPDDNDVPTTLPEQWALFTDEEKADFWNGVEDMAEKIGENPNTYGEHEPQVTALLALRADA